MSALPIGEEISQQDRLALFVRVEDVPHGNRELAYSLYVPKTWSVDSSLRAPSPELPIGRLKPLAIFQGPAASGTPPYLQLQATRLNRDILAAHWLRHFALSQGHTIEAAHELNPLCADQLQTFQLEGQPFKMRAFARIDGDRLFLLTAFAPAERYGELEQVFGLMVASLALLSPSRQRQVELRESRSVGGQVRVQYPRSWAPKDAEDPPPGRHLLDLVHLDDNDAPAGLMRVKVVAQAPGLSLEKLQQDAIDELSEAGLDVRGLLHQGPVENPHEHFKSGSLAILQGVILESKTEQELWVYCFQMTRAWVVLSLLTPSRRESFYLWAVNKRAFELTLETLRAVA